MSKIATRKHLINGVQMNSQFPDTFEIPPTQVRKGRVSGDFIKIGLNAPKSNGERFWVVIDERIVDNDSPNKDVYYQCRVRNDLVFYPSVKFDSILFVHEDNVLSYDGAE